MDDQRDHGQIGEHLENGLQAVLAPDRNQKKEKQREQEPQDHPGKKGHDGQRAGSEADDSEFDGEQDHQDQDANLHQPGQPISLIGDGVHRFGRWSMVVRGSSLVPDSRWRWGCCAQRPATNDRRPFFYPASFPIIVNNGMYKEITMPPMLTPRRPIMTGSSMASMSLVAESTSSS